MDGGKREGGVMVGVTGRGVVIMVVRVLWWEGVDDGCD